MRNRYVLLADLPAIAVAACAAFGLRFDVFFLQNRPEFLPFLVAALLVKPLVFYWFGMYQRFWRYATIQDLIALGFANCAGAVAMGVFVAVQTYLGHITEFSRAVLVADWLFCIGSTAFVRLSVRIIGETQIRGRRASDSVKRVVVVGAGDAGAIVTREMQRNPQLGLVPVAFVDDNPIKVGKHIYGVPVFGAVRALPGIIEQLRVDEVLIAMPRAEGHVVRYVADECRRLNVVSRIVPGVFELLDGKVSVTRLRQVEIADLLRRPLVEMSSEPPRYLHDATVVVTGAGGSIGFELSRQVAYAGPRRLVLIGHGENSIFEAEARLRDARPGVPIEAMIADVRDAARIGRIFETVQPHVVFHAAAHKHVPLMEANPEEAISNNVLGTRVVVDAAVRVNAARLVLVSTDKAVSPASIMGASKRVAESIVREAARRTGRGFVVVRFGNVLGSRGSVVPAFKRQMEAGGPISVTHPEMRRFFMTIPEAVHLVLQAGGLGRGGELYALKMGEPVRIVDLAMDLIRLSGLTPEDIPIAFTGLRPGEKLEESLWEEGSRIEQTPHPDIIEVIEGPDSFVDPSAAALERLMAVAASGDRARIALQLADMIPTYAPVPSGTAH